MLMKKYPSPYKTDTPLAISQLCRAAPVKVWPEPTGVLSRATVTSLVLTADRYERCFSHHVDNTITVQNYVYPTGPTESGNIC